MDVLGDLDGAFAVSRLMLPEPTEGEQPHSEIVVVLAVAIGGLTDAEAFRASKSTLDLGDEVLCLRQPGHVAELAIERDQQRQAECVGPEIGCSLRP